MTTASTVPHVGQKSRHFLLTMFFALYFVQGMVLAFSRTFLKPYLDANGIAATLIGTFSAILLLPFILKIFIGMLSDRVNLFGRGHRQPYIVLGILLAALSFAVAGFIVPREAFLPFAVLIFIGSFSVTIFDTATDGLAVEITPTEQYSTVQGAMVAGRATGFIILAALFGLLVQQFGYPAMFIASGIAMLIPLIWVLQTRDPAHHENVNADNFEWAAFGEMLKPAFLAFAAYAIAYSILSNGVDGLVTLFMQNQFGAQESALGVWGSLRGIGSVVGALIGAVLIARIGRVRAAFGTAVLMAIFAVIIGLATGINYLFGVAFFWGLVWAIQETVFFTLAMTLVDTRIAASMFAMMMAVSNIGQALGEGIPTGLTESYSFQTVFFGLGAFVLVLFVTLVILFWVAPQFKQSAQTPAKS